MPAPDPSSFRQLVEEIAAAAPDSGQSDPEQRRQSFYQSLAEHDDPLLREIGEQLRDGVLRPYQLVSVPGYNELIARGIEQLKQVDMEALHAELVARAEQAIGRKRDD